MGKVGGRLGVPLMAYGITLLNGAMQASGEFMAIFLSYNAEIAKRLQNKQELFVRATLLNIPKQACGLYKKFRVM